MELSGKGLIGAAALLLGSAAAAIGVGGTNWAKNNPVAKTWLSDNHFSQKDKDKFTDFESQSTDTHFALGCHRFIFGGKNFKKLYDDSTVANTVGGDQSSSGPTPLSISDLFTDINEPLLGCSTAYLKTEGSKKVYQYELALRQGDKGFEERISVHEDKIISQLVFYEKNTDQTKIKTDPYKHLFGLYRYIKKDTTSSDSQVYKVAKPTDPDGSKWSQLNLSGTTDSTPRYYSVWVDDTRGEGIFDNLGIKLNDKPFSSVIKNQHSSGSSVSDFVYIEIKDGQSELHKPTGNLIHYDLSVLDSLINNIQGRKGFWKSSQEFCSADIGEGERKYILEVKRLSQYCYEIKKEATATTTPSSSSDQ